MENIDNIIDSFNLRKTLNPKIWDNYTDVEKSDLKPKVKKALSKIANEFIDHLGENFFVDDVVLMGSLVNYNWSQYSDFDLHVLINFKQFGENSELMKENFDLKKDSFNNKHNIKIYGFDVELYAQDVNEEHFSSGVFSVLNDEWVSYPKRENFILDRDLFKKKIKSWIRKINSLINNQNNLDYKRLKNLKDKLKTYRKAGLEKTGELSYENLVFKFLRRSGHIGKLLDAKNNAFDKKLSIENKVTESFNFLNVFPSSVSKGIQTIKDFIDSNSDIKKLIQLNKQGVKIKFEPKEERKYSEDVKLIQKLLIELGYSFPKGGADGLFGEETEEVVKKFQRDNDLTDSGEVGEEEYIKLTSSLYFKNLIKSSNEDEINITSSPQKKNGFTYVNLNTPEGYKIYREIADNFINARNPNVGITGKMLADSAKKYFSQGYVPPELALAQLAAEGGLSNKKDVKPIYTKNPFNVGNTDSGKKVYHNSFESGIDSYYNLMTTKYLVGGKKAEDLLDNFVNINGHQYATGAKYEGLLKDIVKGMEKYSEPVLSKYIS